MEELRFCGIFTPILNYIYPISNNIYVIMAKRRTLKKAINELSADLLIECLAVKHTHPTIQDADVENIALSIISMQEDFVSRLSHVDHHQVRRFFQQLEEDLTVSTNEIIDQIYQLT